MADMKKQLTPEELEQVVGGAKLELKTRPLDDPETGSLGGWVDVYVDGVLRETVRYYDEKNRRAPRRLVARPVWRQKVISANWFSCSPHGRRTVCESVPFSVSIRFIAWKISKTQ